MDGSRSWDRLAGGVSCFAASASLLATFLAGYLGGSFTKGCSWRAGTDMVREGIEEVRPLGSMRKINPTLGEENRVRLLSFHFSTLTSTVFLLKKLPAPAEVERNIKNVVEGEIVYP